ncbi:MAG: hypothetical protein U0Q15_13370 [Kineosporiaceae bacterium]
MTGVRASARTVIAGGCAALVAAAGMRAALNAGAVPGGRQRWERPNHAGHTLTLLEGPVVAAALAAGFVVAPMPVRARVAALVAVAGAGAAGAWDDLAEKGTSKGLRGHLGELARGRVTTGTVKIGVLAASGAVAASLLPPRGADAGAAEGRRGTRTADVLVGAAVVAGWANLVNLFDLRPGRSLKVGLLQVPALATGPAAPLAVVVAGAAAAALPADLRERSMLGDTGANALGAAVGCAVLAAGGRRARLAALAGLTALTLASEKVSFSRVIAATPVLRDLDAWGRLPR